MAKLRHGKAAAALLLLRLPGLKTLPELDDEIEHFLEATGEVVDFQVDDAIKLLWQDGLVSCDSKVVSETTPFRNLTMSAWVCMTISSLCFRSCSY